MGLWRNAFAALTLASGMVATDVAADGNVVVVELYTSQGCSSCPPADKILDTLREQDNVIALALHVDYWDYIGWKDAFADPAHTERQRGYARAANSRTIYTPQMVIGGLDHVIGNRPNEVAAAVETHKELDAQAGITARRNGNRVIINLEPLEATRGQMVVQLVQYKPNETVSISRGENAGRTLEYSNIVTLWEEVGTWDGRRDKRISVRVDSDLPSAVILQRPDQRAIVAAAKVN